MYSGSLPVLVYLSRRAATGREADLVRWAEDLCANAAEVPGYLGSSVRPSVDAEGLDVVVGIRFASAETLLTWERSDQRRSRLELGADFTQGEPTGITLQQLDAAIAGAPSARRVPKWRTALAVWLALYPLALLSSVFLVPRLQALPPAVAVAVSSVLIVALVVWGTLPLVHRLLGAVRAFTSR